MTSNHTYDEALIGMCEFCDALYLRVDEVRGNNRCRKSGFCSDVCMIEAEHDAAIGEMEDV
jgi:hypothetical protein